MGDRIDQLRRRLLSTEQASATTGVSRLWKTGHSAAAMATAVLGGRWKGRGRGLEAANIDAVVRLVERLGHLKGVAMKAGQILGYVDPTLAPELRALLSILQTASPACPFPEVERSIHRALGPRADALLSGLVRAPIAVASIGQVHRGTLPDGHEIAVKVLHPGIEAALASDFKAASTGSAVASMIFGAAAGSVKSFVDEAREALLEECDLQLEARRQDEFAQLLATDPVIVVPPVVFDWCGPGLLTTAWRPGLPLEAWLAGDPPTDFRNRVGEALFRFYLSTLYRNGVFHADPHPGNYGIRDDGRVVVYDFGCVRRFDAPTVAAFSRLVAAVRADDDDAISSSLRALGAKPKPRVDERLRALLRGFFGPVLVPGASKIEPDQGIEAQRVLQDKRAMMELALPGKLLFLFRLRFGLYAVLSRIEAEVDWCELESTWATEALSKHR